MKRIFFLGLLVILGSFLTDLYFLRKNRLKTELNSSQKEILETSEKLKSPSIEGFGFNECLSTEYLIYTKYDEPKEGGNIQKIIGYQNNKFGLYIYSEEVFIKIADSLVNTNGGDWGYVLIPYNVRDYDDNKWGKIFGLLSRKHLIPIIQLWDVSLENYKEETEKAAKFLNKFQWPIKKKYLSAYNETNDARFWKSKLDPEGYARVLNYTIKIFKDLDTDFFVMNGAFNTTAPTSAGYLDQIEYMKRMNNSVPGIFSKLDGWASHPYPQPGFVGKPEDLGRSSIRAYEWELGLLSSQFGIDSSKLPVFITETGWPHKEGDSFNQTFYSAEEVASFFKRSFEDVWLKDERVVAITPFTVYYDPPFDHFSWVRKDGYPYPQYETVKSLKKVAGKPPIIKKVEKEVISCN